MNVRVGPLMLYTERLEAIVPFYRDVLGLPVKSYEPGHSLWLRTEPVEIVLHAPEEPWYPAPYAPEHGGTLLWLQVDGELEEISRDLKAKGADVVVHSGRRSMLLRDPEGRRIGLYEERRGR